MVRASEKKRLREKKRIEKERMMKGTDERKFADDQKMLTSEEKHDIQVDNQLDELGRNLDILQDVARRQGEAIKETKKLNEEIAPKIDEQKHRINTANRRGRAAHAREGGCSVM